ncbi:HD domain-containing protein [Dyadobacter psychrotolerans]|uniref:HD domain-containing protein n=1 Tax=Dyadobacter psychrotolerans TaxID=2541721 RepID=UPI001E3264BA|nr:HD domain-containing protein [Dyadobacter psychrotolerans]
MNFIKLLDKVKKKIAKDFRHANTQGLIFHNLNHTKKVVKYTARISEHYQLEADKHFIVMAAAWFHDSGYLSGPVEGHENRGAEKAKVYLLKKGLSEQTVESVAQCISATSVREKPQELLSQIICDADLYHLGTKDFFDQNKLVRKEAEWVSGKKISKGDWQQQTITFLESHQFKTTFCQHLLAEGKRNNLDKLKKKAFKDAKKKTMKIV